MKKISLIFISITIFLSSCKKKTDKNEKVNIQKDLTSTIKNKKQKDEKECIKSGNISKINKNIPQINIDEKKETVDTVDLFLNRARIAINKGKGLKDILNFPLIIHGYDEDGNSFKDTIKDIESLRYNSYPFNLFFEEYLGVGSKIEKDKRLGENSYYFLDTDWSFAFKLEIIKSKYYITEFEIPGS